MGQLMFFIACHLMCVAGYAVFVVCCLLRVACLFVCLLMCCFFGCLFVCLIVWLLVVGRCLLLILAVCCVSYVVVCCFLLCCGFAVSCLSLFDVLLGWMAVSLVRRGRGGWGVGAVRWG